VLGRIGQSALPPLLPVATTRAKPIQFRPLVLEEIFFAPQATPNLIKSFNDPDPAVRKEVTNAVEKIAPEVLTNSLSRTDH